MKLLVINPFSTDKYDEAINTSCSKVKRDDTQLTVEHLERALPFIRYRYFKTLIIPEIVEKCIKAEQDGFDGVFISCCFEPGVDEARELVDIPVIGGSAPPVYVARQLGHKFGFITDTEQADTLTYEVFKSQKLDVECTSIKSINMGVEQIGEEPASIQDKVIGVIRQQIAEGANSVIIGCTVVAAFFDYENVPEDLKQVPIINANVVAIKNLEMLVDLKSKNNLFVGRNTYRNPRVEELESFRKIRKIHNLDG